MVLELLNDVQVGLLRGVHAGVPEALGDAGDGDAGLAREVALHKALVDSVEDGALQLMMEIHRRLPFVADGVVVQQLLLGDAVEFREGQQRDEPLQPGAGESIFAERDVAHGSFLVHGHPLLVVVAECVVGREFVEHCWVSFLRFWFV